MCLDGIDGQPKHTPRIGSCRQTKFKMGYSFVEFIFDYLPSSCELTYVGVSPVVALVCIAVGKEMVKVYQTCFVTNSLLLCRKIHSLNATSSV